MQEHFNESFVYVKTKKILASLGWKIIAGEPAGGSDHLPRIEIRDPSMTNKGSKGSYKIDIIATKNNKILLTEVKINFNISDVNKLNEICNQRKEHLKSALRERLGLDINEYIIIKSLSLKDVDPNKVPSDFVCFLIDKPVIHQELLSKN
jgi:hypothetical protein